MFCIYADGKLVYSPEFANEGYGVTSPKCTWELNKAGSLEFTMPTSNVMYDKLQKLKTIVTVEENGKEVWRGRILHDEKEFYKRKYVFCEGHLAFLRDAVVHPYVFTGTPAQLWNKFIGEYNSQVDSVKQYQNGDVTVTDPNDYIVRSNTNYPKVYDEMIDKLVNKLGGYIIIKKAANYYYIQYLTDAGKISDQVIQFGVNLLDVTEYITAENIFTVLIPLGAKQENESENADEQKRLTIESVNDGKDYIENETAIGLFGRIVNTYTWDDVTQANNLLTKGKKYLEDAVKMAVTLKIKAVDLHLVDVNTESIKLGDYVRVVSEPHGLDEYFLCSKIVADLQNPDKTEFTFGVNFSAMTDKQINTMKESQNAYGMAEDANSIASNISVEISGDYVRKSEFIQFEDQVNNKLSAVYHYKGTVPNYDSLPGSGNAVGDTYNDNATGANYAWTGTEWDKLSETIDFSAYATKEELEKIDLSGYAKISQIPKNVSELSNDAGYISQETYQALVERVEKLEEKEGE